MAKAPTAKRYAAALFELAGADGNAAAWLDALRQAADAMRDPTVALFFGEPRMPAERKQEAVALLAPGADQLVVNCLGLLVERQSASLLPAIVTEYDALLNERLGLVQAQVTSAAPISAEQLERLGRSLAEMLEQEVVLETAEDASIIGGIVVRVGDRIIDGSVRTRIEALRRRLQQESLA